MRPPLLFAATMLCATPALANDAVPKDLLGDWTVSGVAVADTPVAALVTDDPAFIGAQLRIAEDSLIWVKGTDIRPIDPAIDDCDADPAFADTDGSYTVTCGGAPWGPGAVVHQVDKNEISLVWYDGGTLTLMRD